MNYLYKSLAVCLLSAASLSVSAKDLPVNIQNDAASQGMKQGKGMKGMKGMGMSDEMKDKQARNEQTYILARDELSDQIRDTKSTSKKQKLMDEQLVLIKEFQEKKRQMKKKMMKKRMKMMMQKNKSMKMKM
ncbi:MAG: hypothetical protein GQ582_04470 [Methyloprofundus sp.]|nr:hypothetical protein [Methyloprofundus sp.]